MDLELCRRVINHSAMKQLRGVGMGPLLVLVSPCFRENVVGTCTQKNNLLHLLVFTCLPVQHGCLDFIK